MGGDYAMYELALRREALVTIANILGDAIGTAEDLRDSPISLAQVVVHHLAWMRERAQQAEAERAKLRDLLRRVVGTQCMAGSAASCFHYHGPRGTEQCDNKLRSCLPAALRAEVEAALGEGG